jgi:hypothetical protein
MITNQSPEQNKKQEYEMRRAEKEKAKGNPAQNEARKRLLKRGLIGVFVILGIILITWYMASQPSVQAGEIISQGGIHWHPELTIIIKGKKQEIPQGIGLGVVEQTLHTHDATGVLHLEVSGLVTKDMTKLGRFFSIWGKQFTPTCIFEFCNGSEGKMKMTVNGKGNTEFGDYRMQDKDQIEIRFE